jgi:anhydro-N-acetylmuramic acid kinase
MMSGTSLDGVDAAMLCTDGIKIFNFGPVAYQPYSMAEQNILRSGIGKWQGESGVDNIALLVERVHCDLAQGFSGVDLVGFHGQTLAHDPMGRGQTHQAGSGARLAQMLGLRVAWDFRSQDVSLGGQGAPLVAFFHHALARRVGLVSPVAFVNLGGVGNITWVDPRIADPSVAAACLAFDTGPANAPINDLMRQEFGLNYDKNSLIAAQGQADQALIATFLTEDYFLRKPPKSLDRNEFMGLFSNILALKPHDACATLTALAAAAVVKATTLFPSPVTALYVGGGGRRNGVMMQEITTGFDGPVHTVEALGLNGDMLEAQAFAYLAARVLYGLPLSSSMTTGVQQAVKGGLISRP